MSNAAKLTSAPKAPPKKISVRQINLTKEKAGYTFEGRLVGTALGAPFSKVDEKTGQVFTQQMTFCIFEDKDGSRFKVNQDKGLQTAMIDGLVKEGDVIQVVKLEKVDIGKGHTMNQYDIYALEW